MRERARVRGTRRGKEKEEKCRKGKEKTETKDEGRGLEEMEGRWKEARRGREWGRRMKREEERREASEEEKGGNGGERRRKTRRVFQQIFPVTSPENGLKLIKIDN